MVVGRFRRLHKSLEKGSGMLLTSSKWDLSRMGNGNGGIGWSLSSILGQRFSTDGYMGHLLGHLLGLRVGRMQNQSRL